MPFGQDTEGTGRCFVLVRLWFRQERPICRGGGAWQNGIAQQPLPAIIFATAYRPLSYCAWSTSGFLTRWVEFQSANLCFLRFSLAVCSYLEASRDRNWKSKRHRLVDLLMFHCSSLLLSLFGLKERRWEGGGKFASCCLVLGRKKRVSCLRQKV